MAHECQGVLATEEGDRADSLADINAEQGCSLCFVAREFHIFLPCKFVLVSVSEIFTAKQSNAAEKRYVGQKMRRITRRWVYAAIAIPFHAWTDAAHERHRLACACSTIVKRWHQHDRCVPFESWREQCTLSKMVRCLFLKAILRWNLLALSVSYECMCARAKPYVRKSVCSAFRTQLTPHACILLAVQVAYGTWYSRSMEQQNLARMTEKVVGRWNHVALTAQWDRWLSTTNESRSLRYIDWVWYVTCSKTTYRLSFKVEWIKPQSINKCV